MNTGARLSLIWLLSMLTIAISAPFFLTNHATAMNFKNVLEAPSLNHWLGTDALGRDVLARIFCGSTVSLGVSFAAVLIAIGVGILAGSLSGYFGGWADQFFTTLINIMLCFPTFFLILAVIAVFGPHIVNIAWIIGLTSWMGAARLVRAEVLTLKEREFVKAAKIMGASSYWILTKHLVPNTIKPVFVNAVLSLASAILIESGLSFLGVGVQPPTPSWGNILLDGKATLGVAWWLIFFPGFFIFLTVLATQGLGEYLNKKWHGEI